MLDFEAGDIDAFATGRTRYEPVLVAISQPEFKYADQYSILEAESISDARPLPDQFVLLGPIAVGPDDN